MEYIFSKKKISTFLVTIFSVLGLYAQNCNVDYIGIVSTDIDMNMSKMTSDLYLTQLNEIQNINVFDKRTQNCLEKTPSKDILSKSNISFYTEINKSQSSDKWITIIHVLNPITNEHNSKTTEYDSFYKVLMDAKSNLKGTISQLLINENNTSIDALLDKASSNSKQVSTELLAGTWHGEDFIDKIIILKGGRGFVIFNTGASMTVAIKLENTDSEQKVIITQQGRTNASYYPDLPRKIALDAALEADPIVWTFTLKDSNTLVGSKKTVIASNETFAYDTIHVNWNRIN